MKFRCLFKGHVWITGRVAPEGARHLIQPRKSYHNRACCHCGKEEWNADESEAEAERIGLIREMLGDTRRVARIRPIDPKNRLCDPNEFP